jgi:DHA1 family tetracycline resistance protein-like MFS transporter
MSRPGLGPILLAVFLDLLGFGLVIPLMGFYAETFGATPSQVTGLMAVYSISQLLGAPAWGALSDRVGRRPVLIATIGAQAVFLAAFASATALWQLYLFRALHGLSAANISAAQAYVADVTDGPDRAKGMGLIGAAFGVGFSVGPLVGGQLSRWSYTAPIWLAASLSLINLVWVVARLPESRRVGVATEGKTLNPAALARGLKHPVVGMAIALVFVITFAFSMMESTFQLVAEHAWAMDAVGVGNLFGVIGLIGIIVQGGLIRRLVPRFGEARLVRVGLALQGAGLAILATSPAGPAVWAGCAVLATGSSLSNPSLQALISRGTSEDEQGAVLGVSQSFSAMGRATGPVLGGVVFERLWPQATMLLGAGLMVGALALSWPATRRAAARGDSGA